MSRITKVIPARRWKNSITGQTASLYGAKPWLSDIDEGNWYVETGGWTWRNSNGTIGLGRVPAKTKAEAEAVMHHVNSL